MFGLFKNLGKNSELENAVLKLKLNMSNNYKDAAQDDFRNLEAVFNRLIEQGKLNEKQKEYYSEVVEDYRGKMVGFTHKDQKPYWTKD
ncbi:MAG: hypothetical protein K6E77_04170 [Lachnospiraceae bacterium]|nr:hypothetical protein [Lachnospiraceae bacterium]